MNNLLSSDGYKFSMAEAGAPLRPETFYFSFRRGGMSYNCIDWPSFIQDLLPAAEGNEDIHNGHEVEWLAAFGYPLTGAMQRALAGSVTVSGLPAGSWFFDREPIVSVTGPSFLVSWLEPLLIQAHYRIQVATALMSGESKFVVTCAEQARIIGNIAHSLKRSAKVTFKAEDYVASTRAAAIAITDLIPASRVFEVGMRAATCQEEHALCLGALNELGIHRTSNVALADELRMTPVGTMGHEHIQRWGSDIAAYRAMRDMRVAAPSYLLDTFNTFTSGLPAALLSYQEQPHLFSVRYDSGCKPAQYLQAHAVFQELGDDAPVHIIEDGLRVPDVVLFERLRSYVTKVAPEKQHYGFGGYFVSHHWRHENPYTRDAVSAVYKLSETSGTPRMKFGDAAGLGKRSVPGRPVVWRCLDGAGPLGIVGQEGEQPPPGYMVLTGNPDTRTAPRPPRDDTTQTLSPETEALVAAVKATM